MLKPLCGTLAAVMAASLAATPASALDVKLEKVADGLTAPLLLSSPPNDDRRFIVEQIGLIKILTPEGEVLDQPFLDIRHKLEPLLAAFDEQGLLGLAFHPDFAENGKFYVAYSGPLKAGDDLGKTLWWSHSNYVSEFVVSDEDPNRADHNRERIITTIDWPQFNHNGHWIDFGPDGYLYISTGDGGYANDWGIGHTPDIGNGQDLSSWLGKMLRIDVDGGHPYAVPEDNPFVDDYQALDEIYAYGLRNAWRCSFDMGGDRALFCADVGQNSYEEIDIIEAGGNYGWRAKEGSHCFDYLNPNDHPETCNDSGMIDPIIEYNNCNVFEDCKGLSITGGFVYRGDHGPWDGLYFFGDWSKNFGVHDGRLYVGRQSDGGWTMEDVNVVNMEKFDAYVNGFGQDSAGNVYVTATDTTGPTGDTDRIYKIVPAN